MFKVYFWDSGVGVLVFEDVRFQVLAPSSVIRVLKCWMYTLWCEMLGFLTLEKYRGVGVGTEVSSKG